MKDPILHYLIVFDRKAMVAEVTPFGQDMSAALASYAEKERQLMDDLSVEVVLVGSDSMESVRTTHPNYFPDRRPAEGWLERLGLSHDAILGRSYLSNTPMAADQA
ncbi:MAG: hypothetical protein OXC98_10550 [bacterium]|nr:hypothetical protein [Acidimicrobiia bacterium]MCY4650788.1 hypothetical protein [bacterium]